MQELVGELAKKVAVTSAELSSEQLGRALFGLQGATVRITACVLIPRYFIGYVLLSALLQSKDTLINVQNHVEKDRPH